MSNIPSEFILMFLGMVFIAVFLLSQGVVVPVFGEAGRMRKRIRGRLHVLEKANHLPNMQTVLRQKYLTRLSPLEARLEQLPFMANLTQLIEQSGHEYRAYRVMLLGLILGAAAGALVLMVSPVWWMALLAAFAVTWVPVLKILRDRNKRFAAFEEGLPDALDAMCRALRAGHPFNETLRLVAEEHKGPVAQEFGMTFSDINYGNDVPGHARPAGADAEHDGDDAGDLDPHPPRDRWQPDRSAGAPEPFDPRAFPVPAQDQDAVGGRAHVGLGAGGDPVRAGDRHRAHQPQLHAGADQ